MMINLLAEKEGERETKIDKKEVRGLLTFGV